MRAAFWVSQCVDVDRRCFLALQISGPRAFIVAPPQRFHAKLHDASARRVATSPKFAFLWPACKTLASRQPGQLFLALRACTDGHSWRQVHFSLLHDRRLRPSLVNHGRRPGDRTARPRDQPSRRGGRSTKPSRLIVAVVGARLHAAPSRKLLPHLY